MRVSVSVALLQRKRGWDRGEAPDAKRQEGPEKREGGAFLWKLQEIYSSKSPSVLVLQ